MVKVLVFRKKDVRAIDTCLRMCVGFFRDFLWYIIFAYISRLMLNL